VNLVKMAKRSWARQDWRVMREKPDLVDSGVTLGRWVIHSWEKRD
jgi:hypothetical protein